MNDIRLVWDPVLGGADFGIVGNDLEHDDSLETSVLLSLFTDARAKPGDVIPGELGARRGGWWADDISEVAGDRFGSRLWLLKRMKQEPAVLSRGREHSLEALEWMKVDRVAERIEVDTEFFRRGWIRLVPRIFRPKLDPISFKYDYNWRTQAARRA